MRRIIAVGLLAAFFGQTSGSAQAATSVNASGSFNLAIAIAPLHAALIDSPLLAALTGQMDRYTLMHGAAPIFPVPKQGPDTALLHRQPRAATPGVRFRFGPHKLSFRLRDLAILRPGWRDPKVHRVSGSPILVSKAPIAEQSITRYGHGSRGSRGSRSAVTLGPSSLISAAEAGAGIKPFWDYSPRAIPGAGTAAINVVNGNLLVAQTDVDVHRPGLDLAFTRVYNSFSYHDAAGDDGSDPSIFGNRWTNNYDIHFVYDPTAQTITIFDGTGAAFVYTQCSNATGWCPPAGEHAILATDPNDGCGFAWIQPSGIAYYLHDDGVLGCSPKAAEKGRLYEIVGRNINNTITLSVTYDCTGSPSCYQSTEDIREIDAAHSDGETLTMNFLPFPASSYTEMTSVVLPNSMGTLNYLYDTSGNLIEVDKLGNGTTIPTIPSGHQPIPSGDLPVLYGYYGGSLLNWVMGPRAAIASWKCGCMTPADGSDLAFTYGSGAQLSTWHASGVLNPAGGPQDGWNPNGTANTDGLNTVLQTGPTGWQDVDDGQFVYSSGVTTFGDTPHHGAQWTYDTTTGAVTGHGPWMSSVQVNPGQYFMTTESRDSDLNVVSSTDPNGNVTTFKYTTDSYNGGGDLVERIAPSNGQVHPTDLFSYDGSHNMLSYCDPFATKGLGKSNLASPGPTPCPTQASTGATSVYNYNQPAGAPSPEPDGCLSDVYSGNSTGTDYHTSLTYGGNCGNGLPIQVQGASITQSANSSSRQPIQSYAYYPSTNVSQGAIQGELQTYGEGYGQWSYTYDGANRPLSATDPDGVTSYTCYNADGSVYATTTAKQYALDGVQCNTQSGTHSTVYTYDADGNVITVLHHYGNNGRPTNRYYDGYDRLVEVKTPADANIDGGNPTYTRYIYDLTANQKSLSIGGSAAYAAHGNIYKTQECRAQCPTFTDLNGNAFDQMDRVTARYQYTPTTAGNPNNLTPGTNPGPLETWQNTYDVTGLGLLSTSEDPSLITTTYSYDNLNELLSESFSDNTPKATYTYDPDGRINTASNSIASDTYVWNLDGTLASDTEGSPTGSNFYNPATMTYGYYADGKRMSLAISDNGVNPNFSQTRQYAYRNDGARTYLSVSGVTNPFTWTYTNAGRLSSQTDPQNGSGPFTSTSYTGDVMIGPKALSYNSNGLLSTLTMPDGVQETGFTYDAESEPTGLSVNGSGFGLNLPSGNAFVSGVTFGYDVRGELYQTQATSPQVTPQGNYQNLQQNTFIYGHPESCSLTQMQPQCVTIPGPQVDNLTGAIYSFPGFNSGNGYNVCENISYDADGRQSNNIDKVLNDPGGCSASNVWKSGQWKYDALNHVTSETFCPTSACNGTNTYSWDALGNLRIFNNTIVNYALHWDGDDLLLVTSGPQGQGSVEQFNIEKLAEQNANSLTIYDRDFSGTVVEHHTGQSDSGVTVTPDHFGLNKLGSLGIANITGTWPSSSSGSGGGGGSPTVDMQRTDGYQIGGYGLTFQGVRVYDNNTQQWTTADDYKGDVDDPSTQRAYQWNGNNPITQVDPNGYCSTSVIDANGDILASQDAGVCIQPLIAPAVPGSWDASVAYIPVVTPSRLAQVKAINEWILQPCHRSALEKGAISVGIDSLGVIPGGTLPKLLGRAAGLSGAAAKSAGTRTLTGITGTFGAAQGAAGAVNGDDGGDKLLDSASGAAAVAGLVPVLNEGATGVSIGLDVLKAGKQIRECP